MPVVGRHEHEMRVGPAVHQTSRDLEPCQPGHLHVEHDEIGRVLGDRLESRRPVLRLRHDLDAGNLAEEEAQFLTRQLFVVHHHGAKHFGWHRLRPECAPARPSPE